jgi:hypothetical protein
MTHTNRRTVTPTGMLPRAGIGIPAVHIRSSTFTLMDYGSPDPALPLNRVKRKNVELVVSRKSKVTRKTPPVLLE